MTELKVKLCVVFEHCIVPEHQGDLYIRGRRGLTSVMDMWTLTEMLLTSLARKKTAMHLFFLSNERHS